MHGPSTIPNINEGQSLTATLNLGSGLSGLTATLEGADFDLDSEYTTIHTFVSAGAAGLYTFQSGQDAAATVGNANQLNFRFYRFNISVETGSGAVIGKIEF